MYRIVPVGWRIYPARALAILLTLMLFAIFIWNAKKNWEKESFLDGAIPILSLVIAFAAGTHITRTLRADVPIEYVEDQSTKSWKKINHSFPQLRWSTAADGSSPYVKPAKIFLSPWIFRSLSVFERLLEDTSTENYRVLPFFGRGLFVRVDRRANVNCSLADINLRHLLIEYFMQRPIRVDPKRWWWFQKKEYLFEYRFLRGLKPLRVGFLCEAEFGVEQRVPCQVFRYIEADTHFCGNINQIESFARKFGMLQGMLIQLEQRKNPGTLEDLIMSYEEKTADLRKFVWAPLSSEQIESRWKDVRNAAMIQPDNPISKYVISSDGKFNRELENSIQIACKVRRASCEKNYYFMLHDIHPHNTLFVGNECALILDYAWLRKWPHAEVLAFTMHRFIREHVRLMIEYDGNDNNAVDYSRSGARAFYHWYKDGFLYVGNKDFLTLPGDFGANLSNYITAANIEKMINCFRVCLDLDVDNTGRSIDRLNGEVRKFVRFMKEATSFDGADLL